MSPAPDTADGRCHLSVANLATMPHRSHEWPATLAQLRFAFAHPGFAVHPPVPAPFGDEGAANHMRLCRDHRDKGVEVFVYGVGGVRFPARQHRDASEAVARRHGLDRARTLFVRQSDEAIAAGAFHNDVVAVANRHVLFAHERAFDDPRRLYEDLRALLPQVEIVEVPAAAVSLADAIATYLFNAQLVDTPRGMTLVLPSEVSAHRGVRRWLDAMIAGNGPIRHLDIVDVRESMANGGGPACLRLRIVADPATVDPRFLVDDARLDRIAAVIEAHWPERIAIDEIGDPALIAGIETARAALLDCLGLAELT